MTPDLQAATRPRMEGDRGRLLRGVRGPLLELAALGVWCYVVAGTFLNLDPGVMPVGREYGSAIQPYHLWDRIAACGLCGLWNGSVLGGYPAFVDLHAGLLHPLVAFPSLLMGAMAGARVALFGSFVLAGVAQWWLGRQLGLSPVARLWSAALVVAAGHLGGRMQSGWINVTLSTAAASLVLPAVIQFARTPSWRWSAVLGTVLAMAVVSGQGYLQVAVLITLPAALLLVPMDEWRDYTPHTVAALLVAVLLASPFLVPFLHFLPQFGKQKDASFASAQSLRFALLNFVIDDEAFYESTQLDKMPYAALYTLFIGWIPIAFAAVGLGRLPEGVSRRIVAYLATVACLALWFSTGAPFEFVIGLLPPGFTPELISSVRNPSLMAGLAVPPVVAFAALGLERLLRAEWPRIHVGVSRPRPEDAEDAGAPGESGARGIDAKWLLIVPVVFSLYQALHWTGRFIEMRTLHPEFTAELDALATDGLEWVSPPFGEHIYTERAVGRGLKLSQDLKPWYWRDHDAPDAYLEAVRKDPGPELTPLRQVGDLVIYQGPAERSYAAVEGAAGKEPCTATGVGGDLTVRCTADTGGTLTVKENRWTGWRGAVDGAAVPLRASRWLSVDVPPGPHVVTFTYRPWDVLLGWVMFLVGGTLCGYLLVFDRRPQIALRGFSSARPPPRSA